MRILIIENDEKLNKSLSEVLNAKRYQTDIAENLKDGKYYVSIRNYDLIVANWNLSDISGPDIILSIKEKAPKVPIIIISAKDSTDIEVNALNSGADDYIKQPCLPEIFIARIEARLRSWGTNMIEIGELIINPDEEKIIYRGQEIEVKGKPFEVLTHLAKHRDQIVSKEQLLDAIWEEPELVTPNVIEVAINQIRQKMDKPLGIATIETVRRRGYRFCYPKEAQ
ncbi:homeostatic response regulator transcription factor HsrA [Helicobacter sp. MIT 14-3879]|uniref:homeostatic response regulator transcription factor HsrA n=1 Tax=Helicobacter sp. MIT 14-3879 TaxID=2040649 RepID=UPI000E1F831A|nr:homeostatic response regulator transcription factor HsrA [Helicobacter sp. MIT 14-3879]RDU63475.1 DNA-binding response regulator [Helicobacter sp. MIT 14-3879]